jgi:hypothetical protein
MRLGLHNRLYEVIEHAAVAPGLPRDEPPQLVLDALKANAQVLGLQFTI